MNKDIITLMENNKEKDYQLLLTINDKYIIYSDLDNISINKNIYVIKVDDNKNIIPITDNELNEVEQEYQKIINKKVC